MLHELSCTALCNGVRSGADVEALFVPRTLGDFCRLLLFASSACEQDTWAKTNRWSDDTNLI